jgi:acyl-CoA thioesterase-1
MKKSILLLTIMSLHTLYAHTLLFLGDSLTEGFGVGKNQSYPSLVEEMINKELNRPITIINGGVSASTMSDGLLRLRWYLKRNPSIIFIALGANDGLRGLNLQKSQESLEAIIQLSKHHGAKVLLAGMKIPPNYGKEYSQAFEAMYERVQKKYQLPMMPFLLQGVAGERLYNQADGIHPNAQGYQVIAQNVFEFIKEHL